MKRLLGRRAANNRDQITRKIDNEVDFQEGVMRVSAPSFLLSDIPVSLTASTTAGDVVLRYVLVFELQIYCETGTLHGVFILSLISFKQSG